MKKEEKATEEKNTETEEFKTESGREDQDTEKSPTVSRDKQRIEKLFTKKPGKDVRV